MLLQKFKLGIPIRDMRLLDPNLLTSETGKILVRDNAIVFAMEHIRLIISATAVIIPRDGFEQNLLNARFNALLEESIIEASQEKQHRESRLQHLREIAESDIDDDASSGRLQTCFCCCCCCCTSYQKVHNEAFLAHSKILFAEVAEVPKTLRR